MGKGEDTTIQKGKIFIISLSIAHCSKIFSYRASYLLVHYVDLLIFLYLVLKLNRFFKKCDFLEKLTLSFFFEQDLDGPLFRPCPPVYPWVFLSVCQSLCLSACLPACLLVCLRSFCLSVCLSDCLYLSHFNLFFTWSLKTSKETCNFSFSVIPQNQVLMSLRYKPLNNS